MPALQPSTAAHQASLPKAACYAALQAKDARFDGRFFIGVTSTGVYCRPVCRVRTPALRNCRFFTWPAQAEQQGFRPCLRCRPELAPGLSLADSPGTLAAVAARRLADAASTGTPVSMPEMAAHLGITERHLRRIFIAHYGVAPLGYLTTARLLQAKALLTDTAQPVADVAQACGFGSARRFNAAFVQHYRLKPSQLRQGRRASDGQPHQPLLALSYRPPYDVVAMLHFMARRAVPGLEQVDVARAWMAKTWAALNTQGCIELQFVPERCLVQVKVSTGLAAHLGAVLTAVKQALDLDADPSLIGPQVGFSHSSLSSPPLPFALRLPGAFGGGAGGFESAVRVILGQQISVAAARTLTARLVQTHGTMLQQAQHGLTHLFPTAQALAVAPAESIGQLGIVRQRVAAIQALARAVADGSLDLSPSAALEPTLATLRALPGVGEWTVQLIAMRALAWPDAFPASDLGVLDALAPQFGKRDAKAAQAWADAWRPWRSYAVMHLWNQLEPKGPLP